jgi:hypothetical protein
MAFTIDYIMCRVKFISIQFNRILDKTDRVVFEGGPNPGQSGDLLPGKTTIIIMFDKTLEHFFSSTT